MSRLWSVALRACLDALERLGLDAAEVCRASGIASGVLAELDARIPLEAAGRIWEVAAAQYGPAVGLHAGLVVPFGALESLDYVVATADSVERAVRSMARYFVVVTEGMTALSVAGGGDAALRVTFSGPVSLYIRDYALCAIAGRARRVGADIVGFAFAGPPLAATSDYEKRLGVPVRFHANASSFEIAAGCLRRPVEAQYPGLRSLVVREVERLVASLGADTVLTGARNAIASLLPAGKPRLADVAARLGLSPRTLQRQLRARDQDLSALIDEMRSRLALLHLKNGGLSVGEVGYLCGYAEPSSFSRAFTRWHGKPPGAFRAEGA